MPDSVENLIQFMSMKQVMFSPVIEYRSVESVLGYASFCCQSRCERVLSVDGDVVDAIDGAVDIEERVVRCDHGVIDGAVDLVGKGVYGM